MSIDNQVFRKIKEVSARGLKPRPPVTVVQIASELSVSCESLQPSITQLKDLGLVSLCDAGPLAIKLTLLGSVVQRDK